LKAWNKDEPFMQNRIFKTKKEAIVDGNDAITDSLEIVATVKIEWDETDTDSPRG